MSRPVVILDLAGEHALARDLAAGGVFVPGCTVGLDQDCELVLRGASEELRLAARVVWVDGDRGAGLQLLGCDATVRGRITALAEATATPPTGAPASPPAPEPPGDGAPPLELTLAPDGEAALELALDPAAARAAASPDAAAEEPPAEAGHDQAPPRKLASNIHERLRGLPLMAQIKLAHSGDVQERTILERMYGKNVWEALLRNPRLTGPEVARIARMGTLPRILLEIIVGNGGWLQIPEVRRALLANPRLGTDQILRVLRLLPKHELKLAATQTAYPMAVRSAARKMLRDG